MKPNAQELMSTSGVWVIGDGQRTIAFTVVASGGTGLLNITATAHGLKKWQPFYIGAGAYIGSYEVRKVISANVIQVAGTFGATAAGNINLLSALGGKGFQVTKATGLVIAEFEADSPTTDNASIMAKTYVDAEIVLIPFKKLRITAGGIMIYRRAPRTDLPYRK